jgi:hypothetical protein
MHLRHCGAIDSEIVHEINDGRYSHVRHFKLQAQKIFAFVLAFRSALPLQSKAGGTIIETTVDHALIRGLVTAGP